MADPSIELLEHHLSATGMREQLRQCRIEAESAGSDAGASRSHTPLHGNVYLEKQSSVPHVVTAWYYKAESGSCEPRCRCAPESASSKRVECLFHLRFQEIPVVLITQTSKEFR